MISAEPAVHRPPSSTNSASCGDCGVTCACRGAYSSSSTHSLVNGKCWYSPPPLLCSSVSRPKNVLEILFSLFVLFLGESLKQAGLAGVIQQLDDVEWSTVTRGTRYWASLACTISIDRCYCSSSVCPRLGPATLRAPGCGRKSSLTFPTFVNQILRSINIKHQTTGAVLLYIGSIVVSSGKARHLKRSRPVLLLLR